jgi:ABC-type multidrug transport system fused ATPase/permease subunit
MTQENKFMLELKEEVFLILKNLPLFKLNPDEKKYKRILTGNTKLNSRFGDYKLALIEMRNKPFWFLWTIGTISVALLLRFISIYTSSHTLEFVIALLYLLWVPSWIIFMTYFQMSLLKINSYMKFNRVTSKVPNEYFNNIFSMSLTIFKIEDDGSLQQNAIRFVKNVFDTEIYEIESSSKRLCFLELSLATISTVFSAWILGVNSLFFVKCLFTFLHLPQVVESLNHEKMFAASIAILTLLYRDILQKAANKRVVKLKKSIAYLEIFNR